MLAVPPPVRIVPAILLVLTTFLSAPAAEKKSKVPVRPPSKDVPAPPKIPKPAPAKTTPGKVPVPVNPLKPGAAPAPKVEWKPVYHKGRQYLPMDQVASYYDMQAPKVEGKSITLANKIFRIEMTRGERRVKLNGWTFYFSFSIVERYGKPIVSVFDVRNVLDPIMRPNDRRDPAVLKTVIIDPSGGGTETGIKSPWIAEKDLTLDVAKQLGEKLTAAGFRVVLTRDSDTLVSAAQRQKAADAVTEEAIFISLRANSGSGSTRGFETSTLPPAGTPATDEPDSSDSDNRL